MWKNATFRMVVGIIAALTMTVIFVFEVRIGFNILQRKMLADTDLLATISKNAGSASVTIDAPMSYPVVEGVDPDGDVIQLDGYNIKVKINGRSTDTSHESYGIYKYAQSGTKAAQTLSVESHKQDFDELNEAYNAYIYGDTNSLPEKAGVVFEPTMTKFLAQDFQGTIIPIVYSEGTLIYTAFVPLDDEFVVLTAKDPFIISSEKVSVHYADAGENPQLMHTYSDYEELATKNTIRKLLENKVKDENGVLDTIESPYQSGEGVVGTADTYTSRADNATRAQLVTYADYDWNENGTASGTSLLVDTTSVRAKQSEWKLTSTVYSYSYSGLQLMNLSGQRTSSNLTISGNIMNELDSDRPYVIVVKFVGEGDLLLGLTVIDGRETPLTGNSYAEFSTSVQADDVAIADVVAVQFDIY